MYYLLLVFSHWQPVVLYIHSIFQAFYYRIHPDELAALNHQYGFDRPWYEQWLTYITKTLTGDLGYSPRYAQPVLNVLQKAIPTTLGFVLPGILIALIIGIPFGIKSSVSKPKNNAYITTSSIVGVSIPIFVIALFVKGIIYEFFFYLGLSTHDRSIIDHSFYEGQYNTKFFSYPSHLIFGLRPTGFLPLDSLLSLNIPLFIDVILHMLGPIFCIIIVVLPFVVRMTRVAMVETLKKEYILLARSKGLDERVILYKHAFRNALLPMATLFGFLFSSVILGTVFIEMVFSFPGIGYMFYVGINYFDFSLILAFLFLTTTTYIIFNLVVDFVYYFIDPRIRSNITNNSD